MASNRFHWKNSFILSLVLPFLGNSANAQDEATYRRGYGPPEREIPRTLTDNRRSRGPIAYAGEPVDALYSRPRRAPGPVTLALGAQFWDLNETARGGRFVDEEGTLLSLGLAYDRSIAPRWRLETEATLFVGSVDYSGGLQNVLTGEVTPLKDKTDYLGLDGDLRFAYDWSRWGHVRVEPFLGLGLFSFNRDLGDPSEGGYEENWFSLYALSGVSFSGRLNHLMEARLSAWVAYPVVNREAFSFGSVSPGRKPYFGLELGLSGRRLSAQGFATFQSFGQSDSVVDRSNPFNPVSFLQPATDITRIGGSLRYRF